MQISLEPSTRMMIEVTTATPITRQFNLILQSSTAHKLQLTDSKLCWLVTNPLGPCSVSATGNKILIKIGYDGELGEWGAGTVFSVYVDGMEVILGEEDYPAIFFTIST